MRLPALSAASTIARTILYPSIFYFVAFCFLTYPAIRSFSTAFLTDRGDGLQNVWNIWWVDHAVVDLHEPPWSTTYLHYPYGTSLLGATLNPFNGFLGIPLLHVLTLTETFNTILIFSFVSAGVTAFFLAYRLTGSYTGSIAAGYIFTFSNYHFSHARGHMQLVSLEWIPLFLLFWYLLIIAPTLTLAVASSVTLFLVILCDYYYFLYCIIAACLLLIGLIAARRGPRFLATMEHAASLDLFLVLSIFLAGPLVVGLLVLNHDDPLVGAHNASDYSLDLLSPLIPNSGWRYGELTRGYWSGLFSWESAVYLGLSVTAMVVCVWWRRREIRFSGLGIWTAVALVFALLGLGPVLHVGGRAVDLGIALPYNVLAQILPPLKLSGAPARMLVMTTLAVSVIYAAGLPFLLRRSARSALAARVLVALLFLEYLPAPLPLTPNGVPPYIQALKRTGDRGPVIDMLDAPSLQLYYGTVLSRPMAFGYVARLPHSVTERDSVLSTEALDLRTDVLEEKYGFSYLITPATVRFPYDAVLYRDSQAAVYRLGGERRRVVSESAVSLGQGESPIGPITPHGIIGQTFVASRDGLEAVGLYLAVTGAPRGGRVVLHLRSLEGGADSHDIARVSIPVAAIASGYLNVFRFPAFPHSKGKQFYLSVDAPEPREGRGVMIWANPAPVYPRGTLVIEDNRTVGDLVMRLFYARNVP